MIMQCFKKEFIPRVNMKANWANFLLLSCTIFWEKQLGNSKGIRCNGLI